MHRSSILVKLSDHLGRAHLGRDYLGRGEEPDVARLNNIIERRSRSQYWLTLEMSQATRIVCTKGIALMLHWVSELEINSRAGPDGPGYEISPYG